MALHCVISPQSSHCFSLRSRPYEEGAFRSTTGSLPYAQAASAGVLGGARGVRAQVEMETAERPREGIARFRPCIDIHKGKVKQIVGSTLRDLVTSEVGGSAAQPSDSRHEPEMVINFETETTSAEFAEMYKRDGLLGGHVIMLGADGASQAAALDALRAYPGGLQVGGGISSSNAHIYLDAGASHVIVTSFVFRDGRVDSERLQELMKAVGRKRLVLDLSCRKKDGQYRVVTDRWQRFSDVALTQQSIAELAESADEFLVHGVDVEGMRLGIDEELVALLGEYSPIPVTYAGGARTLEDLDLVKRAGKGGVDITVGSALDIFGGMLAYKDVVAWHQKQRAS
eukprot:TRINITY_DN1683_c0_g1_i1.p1 TRINITY_DN1683_c0_g1~~TRINITY_DN1683_c0_g1_i1.p1  ORF type:complete len:342 (-),score=60.96 TRINITY_DN1683_c0_g1_i1:39-1064(-)